MATNLVGLLTPVDDFPPGLLHHLGLLLNKEAGLTGRDWRVLVKHLNLDPAEVEQVRQNDDKVEKALNIWSQVEPNANGLTLVKVLRQMRHNQAAQIVECYLGEEIRDGVAVELREKLNRGARFGYTKMISKCLAKLRDERPDASFEQMFANFAYTPLHSAALFGHLPAVQLLVESGFDVRRSNASGETPADIADKGLHHHVAQYLREKERETADGGAGSPAVKLEPSDLNVFVINGEYDQLEDALERGANPNDSGMKDWSPLHTAGGKGDMRAAEILAKHGASLLTRNDEGLTPEDWAKKCRHFNVADFLKGKRMEEETKENAASSDVLLNATITVSYEEDDPVEFSIVSLNMADTLKEISDVVGKRVSRLKSKENPTVNVTTMNQLETIREVIAIADDSRSPTPPDDVGPLNFNVDETEPKVVDNPKFPVVLVHSLDDYWNKPHAVSFRPYDDWPIILKQISAVVGQEDINVLYTWDKLSRISTGVILARNQRVIAVKANVRTAALRQKLETVPFIGDPREEEVTCEGADIFLWDHGIIVHVPEGAVANDDKVKITVRVSLPTYRFDIGFNEWKCGELQPAGHPIQISTEPANYKFKKLVDVRIPHCGDVEVNRADFSIAVLAANSQPSSGGIYNFRRFGPEVRQDVRHGYVWLSVTEMGNWFWAFVNASVACRLCTVIAYSHSDRRILEADRTRFNFKIMIVPRIHFYLKASEPYVKVDDEDTTYRGAMHIAVPSGRPVDVSIHPLTGNWTANPERQIFSFKNIWDCLLGSEDYHHFGVVRFRLLWTGDGEDKNSSPVMIQCEINEAERNGFTLVSCANLPNKDFDSCLSAQAKEEISELISKNRNPLQGVDGLALGLGITLPPEASASPVRHVLDAFDRRNGAKHELRLVLEHMNHGEAVAILDKDHN